MLYEDLVDHWLVRYQILPSHLIIPGIFYMGDFIDFLFL